MKIGFSFFWQVLLNQPDPNQAEAWRLALPDIDAVLDEFKNIGISSIELKATEKVDVLQFMQAVATVVEKGFDVTFHAAGRILYPDNYLWQILNIIELVQYY